MKFSTDKIRLLFTLFAFIGAWIIGNFTFPAVALAMTDDHHFELIFEHGHGHIVFFHPEEDDFVVDESPGNEPELQVSPVPGSHEHVFHLPELQNDLTIIENPGFSPDMERGPPVILTAVVFEYLPESKGYYFSDYKYPSGRAPIISALKTVILIN